MFSQERVTPVALVTGAFLLHDIACAFRRIRPMSNVYRGASLIKKRTPLEPYRRHMRRALGGPRGALFLMSEVPL